MADNKDSIENTQIPEIWETEEEKCLTVDGLRRFYKEFSRKYFRNYPYTNKNTGWKIRISSQGIGEIRKFRRREHIILIRVLDKILEEAIFCNSIPDNKNTPGIENVSYFNYKCRMNGRNYTVKLTVKKAFNDDVRFFYYLNLHKI